MHAVTTRRVQVACTVVLLVAVLLLWLVRSAPSSVTHGIGGSADGAGRTGSDTSFEMAGRADLPMSPGFMAPLDLALTNSQGHPLAVTSLHVVIQGLAAPRADAAHPCTTADFVVRQASQELRLLVTAGATATLSGLAIRRADWPGVGLRDTSRNQDGCKAASLRLGYTASGSLVP